MPSSRIESVWEPLFCVCATAILIFGFATFAKAADLVGVVHVQPKLSEADYQKQMKNLKSDDMYKTMGAERVDYKAAQADVVVYIEEVPGTFAPPAENPKIVQKSASFQPAVLPILAGTTVDFPNMDAIFHNVFSYSKTKPFDLGLYKSGASKQITFPKPGQVTMYCSIHRTMKADILVLQNPYFAVTDAKGSYKIPGVPEGKYTLTGWHDRFPEASIDVDIPKDAASVTADLTLGILNLPEVK